MICWINFSYHDQGSKNHPWRFIDQRLCCLAGGSLFHGGMVSGLEPTAAGTYADISNPIAASRHVDRLTRCRGGDTTDDNTRPYAKGRKPDSHLSLPLFQ